MVMLVSCTFDEMRVMLVSCAFGELGCQWLQQIRKNI